LFVVLRGRPNIKAEDFIDAWRMRSALYEIIETRMVSRLPLFLL